MFQSSSQTASTARLGRGLRPLDVEFGIGSVERTADPRLATNVEVADAAPSLSTADARR